VNAEPSKLKIVVAGALGECVHVAGVNRFLKIAEKAGWHTVFLGPAVSPENFLQAAIKENATMVAVSYRLTPETGERLLAEFAELADDLRSKGIIFVFGGTPPVAEKAQKMGFFDHVFQGGEPPEEVLGYLKSQSSHVTKSIDYPQDTITRIKWKSPYPILRHHFGLPTLEETIEGVKNIAEARVLDVISLGIDQDAQENFFHPERQNPRRRGAGGVPVRTPEDYERLYEATRRGNYPLMRTYSGTDDFIQLAEIYIETIQNAWCAIPIFWFNQMDGRGPWDLEGSIREHQKLMKWYGERNIPVELNEPHHWGMRDAPDVISVVAAFLSAYNAKQLSVENYIAQMMFNSPADLSTSMDIAKWLAVLELITPLESDDFHIFRQTRTGLLSYPLEVSAARSHLSTTIYVQMALKPHIVHIVGHTEAHHAATADDIIEASHLASRAIDYAIEGQPNMTLDPIIQKRKEELINEAQVTLQAIRSISPSGIKDPYNDPKTLSLAVQSGIMDAPQLMNNPFALGKIRTKIDKRGACVAIDPDSGVELSEKDRIERLGI